MDRSIEIGSRVVGEGQPVFVIAEIGLNHNGDVAIAKRLIDVAADAGCDVVKFQKRTPELVVPEDQRDVVRETPWGQMTYLEYRHRVEFGQDEYEEIDQYCRSLGIPWFASCWDELSVDFVSQFDVPAYKIASASLTDHALIARTVQQGRPTILSTGMSTMEQIRDAADFLPPDQGLLAHATSTYPCPPEELNLRMIHTLMDEFSYPIGYSGHEVGIQTSVAAVALGAAFIERHITLDRAMWGSDQAASVEPVGLVRLVRGIRVVEAALGTGIKRVYDSEMGPMKKLRRVG